MRYDELLKSDGINRDYITRDVIVTLLSQSPAPQFYISPKMAERYITAYFRNELPVMRSAKQQMISDMVQVFKEVRGEFYNKPMVDIWNMVVEHPAPSFYMSKSRIKEIIYNWRKYGNKK